MTHDTQANREARCASASFDDEDAEVLALRRSAEFMSYLADAERRAATGPRKTLQQVRESLNVSQ